MMIAWFVLFAHNGDMMVCTIHSRTHQVYCAGIYTDILFVGVFLMDGFCYQAAIRPIMKRPSSV